MGIFFINIVLVFREELGIGLQMTSSDLISSWLGKLLLKSAYLDIGLIKKVRIKTKDKQNTKEILNKKELQESLSRLYQFSENMFISDRDIRFHDCGTIIEKEKALGIMDLMADVARQFHQWS